MPDLTWTQCPYCRESTDLKRVGKPLVVKAGRDGKLHTSGSTLIKCGFCGKTFQSNDATMLEAMGNDQENDTSF